MLSIFFLTYLFAFHIYRAKADIEATFDDVVVDFANPEYLDLDHTKAYVEPNEEGLNALFAEVKIIKVFDIEKTIARGDLKELSMGRYNKVTGIDVSLNICDALEPVIIGPFLMVMGFPNNTCPPPIGHYQTEGYLIPNDVFPESFAENKFLFTWNIRTEDTDIFTARAFIDVIEYD